MTEVARALVLPDFGGPPINDLLSLLLVWEEVEVDIRDVGTENRGDGGDEERQRLVEEGLIREIRKPFNPGTPRRSGDDLISLAPEEIDRMATQTGIGTARAFMSNIRDALDYANRNGLAPLAISPFASVASSLPYALPSAPITEATMIHVASPGLKLDSETTVEDVLRFREKNAALIGRFRASLIDLAASIEAQSTAAAAEQARSILANRIEPALADLSDELARGRIRFAVRTLLGATAIGLSTATPASASVAGGRIATQSLRYAFDRDRLVREHPFGLLHRVRSQFDTTVAPLSDPHRPVTDPERYVAETIEKMMRAALEKVAEMFREEALERSRGSSSNPPKQA
jgi:hypothetical protein